ncbi:hypothetical protein FRC02_003257 [Tulasnella sp. 418]|nr:hypothetical protein FRC02_003257 [Tulasnella sp. 418]
MTVPVDLTHFEGTELGALDKTLVKQTLSNPPFVHIEGIINSRVLPLPSTRRRIIRSGEISRITGKGVDQLKDLGVTRVFDFRTEVEINKYKTATPQLGDIEVVSAPALIVEKNDGQFKEALLRFAGDGIVGFLELYTDILDQGGPAFKLIFEQLRDKPDEGCLFHCTAGKDRTGVAAMLILSLAGLDDDAIAKDYALTRIGIEPAREMILMRFKDTLQAPEYITPSINAFGSRYETMLATLEMFRNKYGSIEEYLKTRCELSDGDLETIKALLTA